MRLGKLERDEIPVIETERLILRAHRPDDFKDCAAMWGDPGVTRYIGGIPFSGEEVWTRMLRYAGHWTWFGTVCLIHPENRASIRVAEKCGYREALRTAYHGHETILFGREPGAREV
jgi:RimJ/RimL family protein N-acetyltransferase